MPYFEGGDFNDEFSKLNHNQKNAVLHGKGRALCIAGPGSGKTRVITMRAMKLLGDYGDEAIGRGSGVVLTMAFNTAAGAEMRERAEVFSGRFFDRDAEKMMKLADFSTIHAYCYRIILAYAREKGKRPPRVLSDEVRENLLGEIYKRLSGARFAGADTIRRISRYVSSENYSGGEENDPLTERIKAEFSKVKRRDNAVDFDDMQKDALLRLKEDEGFRKRVGARYTFYQVDEAQDMSPVQREIVELVAGGNVFFVADDDQSIYGFRGANPELLKSLATDGATLSKYMLTENYRSGDEIVNLASAFIGGNRVRFGKRLSALNRGGKIAIETFSTAESEARAAAALILSEHRRGRSVCVLYRNNASGMLPIIMLYIASRLHKMNLRPLVRGDFVPLSDLLPLRRFADKIQSGETPREALKRLENSRELDLVLFTEDVKGKRRFFEETVRSSIKALAEKTGSKESFIGLAREADAFVRSDTPDPCVCFSTVHSAKGLEFDTVMVVDCVKGEFPTTIDIGKTVEEERRLMYVAMTRAKSKLVISYPRQIGKMQLCASAFFVEIMAL